MAQGGGRGWFHRRKPHPEPEPVREPEPTRLEAYEAAQSDFDALLRPPAPAIPDDSARVTHPASSDEDRFESAESDDDRFAPPRATGDATRRKRRPAAPVDRTF